MRQFVFVYRGRLDKSKYNTETRLRSAGAFLLHCFNTYTAGHNISADTDDIAQVDAETHIIELGCTLHDVEPDDEAELVEYLKDCLRTMNSLDQQKFAELGW